MVIDRREPETVDPIKKEGVSVQNEIEQGSCESTSYVLKIRISHSHNRVFNTRLAYLNYILVDCSAHVKLCFG